MKILKKNVCLVCTVYLVFGFKFEIEINKSLFIYMSHVYLVFGFKFEIKCIL